MNAPTDIADREIMGGFLKGLSVIEAFDRDNEALTIAEVARPAPKGFKGAR